MFFRYVGIYVLFHMALTQKTNIDIFTDPQIPSTMFVHPWKWGTKFYIQIKQQVKL